MWNENRTRNLLFLECLGVTAKDKYCSSKKKFLGVETNGPFSSTLGILKLILQ